MRLSNLFGVALVLTVIGCAAPANSPQNSPQDLSQSSAPPLPSQAALPDPPQRQPLGEGIPAAAPTATVAEAPSTGPAVTIDGANPLTPEQETLLASLKSQGLAPELENEVWLNSAPLKLEDLRGKVVIVEFWTYG